MLHVAAREHGTLHEWHPTRVWHPVVWCKKRIANKKTLAAKARGLSDKRSFDFAKTQK